MTDPQSGGATERFVQEALAQAGDRYDYGEEVRLTDANPAVFDCSELVQWAAHRVGVEVGDGSWLQYLQLQQQGGAISVEQALHTRGALLFYFSETPTRTGGRPGTAHVAISLGDGRTIEARSPDHGVGTFTASAQRFNYAAVIPGLSTATTDLPDDSSAAGARATAVAYTMPDAPLPGAAESTDTATGGAGGSGPNDPGQSGPQTDPGQTDPGLNNPGQSGPQPDPGQNDPSPNNPGQPGPEQTDADSDSITDAFEALLGTNPDDPDSDDDGLGDAEETALFHTNPLDADTDDDGESDAAEVAAGTDAGTAVLPQAAIDAGFGGTRTLDADQDGLSNHLEQQLGTRFDVADSDSDSVADGYEQALGSDPLSIDTNRDGVTDDVQYAAGTLGPGSADDLVTDLAGPDP